MFGLHIRIFNPPIVPVIDFGYLSMNDSSKIAEQFARNKVSNAMNGELVKSAIQVANENMSLKYLER